MKKPILFILALFCTIQRIVAQSPSQEFRFANIPWNSTPAAVIAKMQKAGYASPTIYGNGNFSFNGRYSGYQAIVVVSFEQGEITDIGVGVNDRNNSPATYRALRNAMIRTYGQPIAIADTNRKLYTMWKHESHGTISNITLQGQGGINVDFSAPQTIEGENPTVETKVPPSSHLSRVPSSAPVNTPRVTPPLKSLSPEDAMRAAIASANTSSTPIPSSVPATTTESTSVARNTPLTPEQQIDAIYSTNNSAQTVATPPPGPVSNPAPAESTNVVTPQPADSASIQAAMDAADQLFATPPDAYKTAPTPQQGMGWLRSVFDLPATFINELLTPVDALTGTDAYDRVLTTDQRAAAMGQAGVVILLLIGAILFIRKRNIEKRSYVWGYVYGLSYTTASLLLLISTTQRISALNKTIDASVGLGDTASCQLKNGMSECCILVVWLVCIAVAGLYTIRRKRLGFVVQTVLSCNPFIWLVNAWYIKKRWNDFNDKPISEWSSKGLLTAWAVCLSYVVALTLAGTNLISGNGSCSGPAFFEGMITLFSWLTGVLLLGFLTTKWLSKRNLAATYVGKLMNQESETKKRKKLVIGNLIYAVCSTVSILMVFGFLGSQQDGDYVQVIAVAILYFIGRDVRNIMKNG